MRMHKAMRCSTPGMRTVEKSNAGTRLSTRPTRKITAARRARPRTTPCEPWPALIRRSTEIAIEAPAANRKNGNTRSVKVQPFQAAWARGAWRCAQSPGLFTSTIEAMAKPRKASSESRRSISAGGVGAVAAPAEVRVDGEERRHGERGQGRDAYPDEEAGVAQLLLDPAARHARHHHAERHEPGADRVVGRLVAAALVPARHQDHEQEVGGEAEAVAELLHGDRGGDEIEVLRHRVGEVHEREVGKVDREQHRPQPAL